MLEGTRCNKPRCEHETHSRDDLNRKVLIVASRSPKHGDCLSGNKKGYRKNLQLGRIDSDSTIYTNTLFVHVHTGNLIFLWKKKKFEKIQKLFLWKKKNFFFKYRKSSNGEKFDSLYFGRKINWEIQNSSEIWKNRNREIDGEKKNPQGNLKNSVFLSIVSVELWKNYFRSFIQVFKN